MRYAHPDRRPVPFADGQDADACGDFDISFEPEARAFAGGYDESRPHAVAYPVEAFTAYVAAPRDIIASKEAANRAKDQAAPPHLYTLEDEIAAIEREGRT